MSSNMYAVYLLTVCSKQYRDPVTIVIGSAKKSFVVHKELLVFYSDYFRAAFNGSFVEATEKKITLLDVKQQVFDHFHAWLYTRKLASEDDKPLEWHHLINLWAFGDRFQVPMLQNCVMDELLTKERREAGYPLSLTMSAYKKTAKGSPLRKAMIGLWAYETELDNDKGGLTTFEHDRFFTLEILADLVVELDSARRNKVPHGKAPKRDKCFYHVHGKDEHC